MMCLKMWISDALVLFGSLVSIGFYFLFVFFVFLLGVLFMVVSNVIRKFQRYTRKRVITNRKKNLHKKVK
jgi:membrane protein implicated in regulation of membrane protease activity